MDLCHLKNSELEPQFQKYNGRVVLRVDIVKDDSGSSAASIEQGSSASQMTAEKVMDIKSRLPGCSGQAEDAVSAFSQVRMEDALALFNKKFQSQNVQIFGYVYQSTNGPNHGPVWKTLLFILNEICTVIFYQDCYGKGNLEVLLKHRWEKVPHWDYLFVNSKEKGLFLFVCGRCKIGWQETEHQSDLDNSNERR